MSTTPTPEGLSALISKLTTASVIIGNLPGLPGYNGSILIIDDTEAERIVADLDEVCAALSYQPPSAQEASDLISSYTNALVAWRCDGGPFGEVEAAEKELRAALACQAKSAAPVEPAEADLDAARADVGTGVHRDLYNRIVRHALKRFATPTAAIQEAPKGTFDCHVCGKDTPHHHPEVWTLTAPDGRQWHGDSPIKACREEQRSRIPDAVAVERVMQMALPAAIPEAPAQTEPVVRWDDPRVQKVYELLVDAEIPPPEQHWEGWVARRIVDALAAARLPGDDDTKGVTR